MDLCAVRVPVQNCTGNCSTLPMLPDLTKYCDCWSWGKDSCSTTTPEDTTTVPSTSPEDTTTVSSTTPEDTTTVSSTSPEDTTTVSSTTPEDTTTVSSTTPEDTTTVSSTTPTPVLSLWPYFLIGVLCLILLCVCLFPVITWRRRQLSKRKREKEIQDYANYPPLHSSRRRRYKPSFVFLTTFRRSKKAPSSPPLDRENPVFENVCQGEQSGSLLDSPPSPSCASAGENETMGAGNAIGDATPEAKAKIYFTETAKGPNDVDKQSVEADGEETAKTDAKEVQQSGDQSGKEAKA